MKTFKQFLMESRDITLQQIKSQLEQGDYVVGVKFVKVGDEYRFTDIMYGTHIDLVKEGELPLVDGAGTVFLYADGYKVENSYSMTVSQALKDKNMDAKKAGMNEGNYEFFEKEFGEMKY